MALLGCRGSDRPPGTIEGKRRSEEVLSAATRAQTTARQQLAVEAGEERAGASKQILFGDLHAHTTYSLDAFLWQLPLVGGEGAHPPADACDFARHCAGLDFFALTDHAETMTPEHWQAERESIRQCNALAGDAATPDLVAFLGFEWSQVGKTPEKHYGHRCVVFPGLADDELPARPISALPYGQQELDVAVAQEAVTARLIDPLNWHEYNDAKWFANRIASLPPCDPGVDTRALPADCHEYAPTPDVLFEKLDQWGFDSLVIPHGTTWGAYTPPTSSLDKQLARQFLDEERQRLIEIMSGHGNSEEYRAWREFEIDESGEPVCPPPTPDYLPCCWRAGEIMRSRCGDLAEAECEKRVAEARNLAMQANVAPHLVFPDTEAEDWLDCGQCRDCFKPSFGYCPRSSVQFGMALSNFAERDAEGRPLRFRYGFIASSDNHSARPGTGYKQVDRHGMTDTVGARSAFYDSIVRGDRGVEDRRQPQAVPPALRSAVDAERQASFFFPGGLVAVHADGRGREAIWEALRRREVYGTSGPRILLWFDLVNESTGPHPMGAVVRLRENPRFEVRAMGAWVQKPGCPDTVWNALSNQRLERLCRGHCYHPSDQRQRIAAIEVIRIRPQAWPGEPVDMLIDDPWKRFDCPGESAGCVVRFQDEEFVENGRDTLYYVRALQQTTPAISGATLRTELDAEGRAVAVNPCSGSYRTPADDDCLAPVQERAWSSPIFVNFRSG